MSTTPPLVRFELEVQPQASDCPWHAVLRRLDFDEQVEFDSPLALARYLAQFLAEPLARRGLR